jgi:ABC-type spermidine/putrescine transport system permease subunit II
MVKFLVYALLFVCLAVAVRGSIRGLRNLPPYVGPLGRAWYIGFRVICGAILLFLIMPILVIIPLSFNAEPYFTYPMPGFSLRWYEDFFVGEQSAVWHLAIKNSTIVAIFATFIATALGTIAAVGLSNSRLPGKTFLMGLLISPMIVPLVITAVGMYFFYSVIGFTPRQLSEIWSGLHLVPVILAHAALGTPFVVITVTATLVGFDQSLIRASASLGADGIRTFFKIDNRAAGDAGYDLRCAFCLHYFLRRSGRGAVPGRHRGVHHSETYVLRDPRADQPDDSGGGHDPGGSLHIPPHRAGISQKAQ